MKGRSALPRRAFLVALTVVGAALVVAVWGRGALARLPYFTVRRVEVIGVQLMAPDSVLHLAAIQRDRSIWDDFGDVERRLPDHPLIERAEVRRAGLRTLRIAVDEVQPIALVGVPELRAARADGRILPIDPACVALDLPVLTTSTSLAGDGSRLEPGPAVAALEAFDRLRQLDPGLAAAVSDFAAAQPGGLVAHLAPSQPVLRMSLPRSLDETVVRRLRAVLDDLQTREIHAASLEARLADQIVVRVGRNEGQGRRL